MKKETLTTVQEWVRDLRRLKVLTAKAHADSVAALQEAEGEGDRPPSLIEYLRVVEFMQRRRLAKITQRYDILSEAAGKYLVSKEKESEMKHPKSFEDADLSECPIASDDFDLLPTEEIVYQDEDDRERAWREEQNRLDDLYGFTDDVEEA